MRGPVPVRVPGQVQVCGFTQDNTKAYVFMLLLEASTQVSLHRGGSELRRSGFVLYSISDESLAITAAMRSAVTDTK